ncbi:MAG: discoidin domain-containing protein [Thermoguttaceae bacterium]
MFCRTAVSDTKPVPVRVMVDVGANSQSLGNEAFRAMDGDPNTIWRTRWDREHKRHPHDFTIDLGETLEVTGFVYQPPKGGGNGSIKDYEFFVSDDANNFGSAVGGGAFDETDREKKIELDEPRSGRYVMLRARSEIHGRPWASIAELRILSDDVTFRSNRPTPQTKAQLEEIARRGRRPAGDSIDEVLDLAIRTLEFVELSRSQPRLRAELRSLEKKIAGQSSSTALIEQVRQLRRRMILAHPALNFDRLLINKRPPPGYSHMCDQYLGRHSRTGPGLCVLESWKDNPRAKVLLQGKLPEGSMLHPDLSYDGRKVLFSFCDHTIEDTKQRRFLVYEATVDGRSVRQVTGTPNDPMEGWEGRQTVLIEDFDPCYLPGGGFAFISTRSQSFGRCHGSRYVPTYMVYRAALDGSNIRQLSFGEANEWEPSVMNNGRLVYCRWDYINRHDVRYQSLWAIAPDGTTTSHFYGNYSPSPCMTTEPRAVPGSQKVVCTTAAHHSYSAGSIVLVDTRKGQDGLEPLKRITPEISFPEASDRYGGGGSGAFCMPYALNEDLYLAAYTPENRTGQGGVQAVNAYGIYLIDSLGGRELIYRDPQMSCFTPIPLRRRPMPPALPSHIAGREDEKTGTFYLQNVYAGPHTIEPGSITHIRINRIHGQPTNSKPQLSFANNEIIKEIVGTVPVDRTGSALFTAPAGVPLQLQALDRNGMAVMTMRSVVYLQPGETASCVGCHESRNSSPMPVPIPRGMRLNEPTPPAGPHYAGGFSFMRTVQPVLDRYCIECHGLKRTDAGVNLLGIRENGYNRAYNTLAKNPKFVTIAYRNQETGYSSPKEYFAHGGQLANYLMTEHRKYADLDRESFQRIVDWLDLNTQYYGDYSRNRVEDRSISGEAEKALRETIGQQLGSEWAGQPLEALINVAQPSESRILNGPLPKDAGGWGQTGNGGFRNTSDPAYREIRQLVEACIVPQQAHDVAGTCGREHCGCGTCWTRKIREAIKYPAAELEVEPFPRNVQLESNVQETPKDLWTLVRAASEETIATDGQAVRAFDGDPNTYWHTQTENQGSAHPHDLVIDLGATYDVCGFRQMPRRGLGDIRDCEFYVSNDRDDLGKPVAQGTFTDRHAEQTVTFEAKEGRYVMLRALTEADGSPYTAVREITVLSIKPVDEVAVAE